MASEHKSQLLAARALLAALVVAAVAASDAAAANKAPNADFEANCAGFVCNWTTGNFYGSAEYDSSTAHSGSASMRLRINNHTVPARSDCIAGVSPGTYNGSVWVRVPGASLGTSDYHVAFYSGPGCTGSGARVTFASAVPGSNWTLLSGSVTAPAGTQSAQLQLDNLCEACQTGVYRSTNFDDVVFESGAPTLASSWAFRATRHGSGAILTWRAGPDARILGFNVYGERNGARAQVNRALIPSIAHANGRHRWRDPVATLRGSRYWLQAVRIDGSRRWVAFASVGG